MTHTLEALRAGQLAGARHIKLACGLTEFPRELFTLADTLETLDLTGNALADLPDDLPRFTRLRTLFASNNRFTALPPMLGACASLDMIGFKANQIRDVPASALPAGLRWLILTDNAIETLPHELGSRTRLRKLMLAGNRLRALPDAMAGCTGLELIRLAANRLDTLPAWLWRLPRLAWLAYAGNPFSAASEAGADAQWPTIDWHRLALGQTLGEGASGVIHRATELTPDGHPSHPVALKLFKGAVTSDGLPELEMAACLQAGGHPNLVALRGVLSGHPRREAGLVMELIDPRYTNLAGPPSLASCTRDVYPELLRFDAREAVRIAHGIASAVRHLHARGIVHGDLYAHNIVHDGAGHALLGDFGAASFLVRDEAQASDGARRVEARAFGCLLEELIERSETVPGAAVAATLAALRDACLSEHVAARPAFDEIEATLAGCLA
ncbi:MAG: Internalin-A [Burkholderia plantarii]|nr:MAG: Internalin-A [Burkholderia plantarii]